MKNTDNYYNKKMPVPNLGLDIFLAENFTYGKKFKSHWHENMQLYLFIQGKALISCGSKRYNVTKDSIIIINPNELHSLESLSNDLKFYTIRMDSSFLSCKQTDLCQTKFLSPLSQNLISFHNLIENDKDALYFVESMIDEYLSKETGYELAVKASVYQLLVLMLREYVDGYLSERQTASRLENLRRLDAIFKYIDENFDSHISSNQLAKIANVTTYHFCRLFKQTTGYTPTEYITMVRLEKAAGYLKDSDLNITEIALQCGFDSVNYFSRLFKKHYKVPPTQFKKCNM